MNVDDERYMASAITLARSQQGLVCPNPPVGCVLVQGGYVIGKGKTAIGGRPHAEIEALCSVGTDNARGATAYVTLEPCSHYGVTAPCVEKLISSGIERAVIAMKDPDPRVNGTGIRLMQEAGIQVSVGVKQSDAYRINFGFIKRALMGLPELTIKIASSLDGRCATSSGESRWISGHSSRVKCHIERSKHSAIMVGIGTVLEDNPELTVRIHGYDALQPTCIVVDTNLRIPIDCKLVQMAHSRLLLVYHGKNVEREKVEYLRALGVIPLQAEESGRHRGIDIRCVLHAVAERGITRVLCEGGGTLVASLIKEKDVVDRIIWVVAGCCIGSDARASCGDLGILRLGDTSKFALTDHIKVDNDIYSIWEGKHLCSQVL